MARPRLQEGLTGPEIDPNEVGGARPPFTAPEVSSPRPGELFPDEGGRVLPSPPTQGSLERPREIEGPGRDVPTKPLDVRQRSTSSGADEGAYTPSRPSSPSPVAATPPQPFSPMAPSMDPGAMSVAMRAPFMASPTMPSPTAQYGGGLGSAPLLGSTEGLTGGGFGLGSGDGFEDLGGEDPLDALIRILLSGQA